MCDNLVNALVAVLAVQLEPGGDRVRKGVQNDGLGGRLTGFAKRLLCLQVLPLG